MKLRRILLLAALISLASFSCKREDLTHGFADKGSIRVSRQTVTLAVGEKLNLGLSFNSRQTESREYAWSSENGQVASVTTNDDKSGTVTALAQGTTTIRVESADGQLSAVCEVVVNNDEIVKILAIGNSFSEDAVENYLFDLAAAAGKKVIIGNMYIGGASLENHWNNASNNQAAYEYRKIGTDGILKRENNVSLYDAIGDENWDFISMQQVSQLSGIYDSYEAYLPSLLEYVKGLATNPEAKYMLHQTWAYAKSSDHSGFANYDRDQMKMYNALTDATWRAADLVDIDMVIPSGTAIQNGRTTVLGDNFCRDGYHLELTYGRFTAACTWFEKIFGINVVNVAYKPATVSDYNAEIAKHAAHYAVANPQVVTVMEAYKNAAPNNFVLTQPVYFDFGLTLSGTPWNNMPSYKSGKIDGLLDAVGANTGFVIELTNDFEGDNAFGPSSSPLGLPSQVLIDAFFGSTPGNPSAGFTLSRLNKTMEYDFTFFASRIGAGDNRETAYNIKGGNEKTVYLNASNNTGNVVTATNIKPDADGVIIITIGAGPNNNNGAKYYYLNSMSIQPAQ